ncbi:hypothetical protein, partial [Thiolapillus sp.]|uniref:hypothetical protein n=1 Tax=Thiolapillus sp. TaxID=2017437 RepID=UPI003AF7484B
MGFSAVGGFEGIEVYFVGKSDPDQYLLTKQFSEMKLLEPILHKKTTGLFRAMVLIALCWRFPAPRLSAVLQSLFCGSCRGCLGSSW